MAGHNKGPPACQKHTRKENSLSRPCCVPFQLAPDSSKLAIPLKPRCEVGELYNWTTVFSAGKKRPMPRAVGEIWFRWATKFAYAVPKADICNILRKVGRTIRCMERVALCYRSRSASCRTAECLGVPTITMATSTVVIRCK